MMHSVTEWVRVTGETAIIARESGEVWFHGLDGREADAAAFAERMTGGGTLVSTTGLLDGAISLAFEQTDSRFEQTNSRTCFAISTPWQGPTTRPRIRRAIC